MKFEKQNIQDVSVIHPVFHADERGSFRRIFCPNQYSENEIFTNLKQINIAENLKKYTLRGMHYAICPPGEGKVLTCIKGHTYNIIVDLRPDSDTYCKKLKLELSEKNGLAIYLPPGCANGYLTLKDNTAILYYHSEFYSPSLDAGVRYNDNYFDFEWPHEPLHISDKDETWSDFVPQEVCNA